MAEAFLTLIASVIVTLIIELPIMNLSDMLLKGNKPLVSDIANNKRTFEVD